jgi:hypothetical protein
MSLPGLHLSQLAWLTSPLSLAVIALLALGVWRAVAGPAPARPVRTWVLVTASVAASVGWLGTPTAVIFAPAFAHAATFTYVAFVTAWAWMLRERQSGTDENGGGDQRLPPDAPEDPGGGGVDWDAFEKAFWSHVRDRDLTPV